MKKLFTLSLILCLVGIVLSSCSDDNKKGEGDGVELTAPTNLQSVPRNTTVRLTWDGSATAKSYEVECNDSTIITSDLGATFISLLPAQDYSWRVRALRDDVYSEWATATFVSQLPTPQDLQYIAGATSADISWKTTVAIDSFEVRIGEERVELIKGTNMTVDQLSINTTYSLQVRSMKNSAYSEWATTSFKTLADTIERAHRWEGDWSGEVTEAKMNFFVDIDLTDSIPDDARIEMNIVRTAFNTVQLTLSGIDTLVPPQFSGFIPEITAETYQDIMAVNANVDFGIDTTFAGEGILLSDMPILGNLPIQDLIDGLGSLAEIFDPETLRFQYFAFKIKDIHIESILDNGDQSFTMTANIKPSIAITTNSLVFNAIVGTILTNTRITVKVDFTKI